MASLSSPWLHQVRQPCIIRVMEYVLDKLVGFLIFFGAAVIAAMLLAYLAHDELGIPRYVVRDDALVSALLGSGLFAIVFFFGRFGRRR